MIFSAQLQIFDRLYEDWSTLDKFQRTRGVLQYMAIVIHHLWNSDNRDVLIMPGSIPLYDSTVLNKSIHYLPQGWEPVIEKEVDGPRSEPASIDGHDTRFGGVQATKRAMQIIFLGSAPHRFQTDGKGIIGGADFDGVCLGGFCDMVEIMIFGPMQIGRNQFLGTVKSMKILLVRYYVRQRDEANYDIFR